MPPLNFIFAGICGLVVVGMLIANYLKKKKPEAKPTEAKKSFIELLNNLPVEASMKTVAESLTKDLTPKTTNSVVGPTREAAVSAVFLLIDYCKEINQPQVGKLIAEQLPVLAGGKVE